MIISHAFQAQPFPDAADAPQPRQCGPGHPQRAQLPRLRHLQVLPRRVHVRLQAGAQGRNSTDI